MTHRTQLKILAVAAGLATAGLPTGALAQRLEAGMLKCEVGSGVSFIVSSTRDMHCVFHKNNGQNESYGGKIHSFGLEVGVSAAAVIVWAVVADTVDLPPGELSGRYGGAEAGGAVLVGASARVLVGGSRKTVSLQPVSVEAGVGLNLAVGVTEMDLFPLFRAPAPQGRPATTRAPAVGIAHAPEHRTQHHPHYGCGSYVYTQSSDTIYRLSQKCGVSVGALISANPEIGDWRALRAGQIVHIPSHVAAHRSDACGARVTLGPDESLDDVAARCGVTLHALLRANPELRDLESIRAGATVLIPRRQQAVARTPIRVVQAQAPQPVTGGANLDSMQNQCIARAARAFGTPDGAVAVTYEGQRTDRTHAVNGSAATRGGERTFQCSYNAAGNRIIRFVVNPAASRIAPATNATPAPTPTQQRGISRAMPTRDEQACLQAVSQKTNNGDVQLMTGTETSEANNAVYIGVGPNRAIWRCLVKDGRVAVVMSMTNEGRL